MMKALFAGVCATFGLLLVMGTSEGVGDKDKEKKDEPEYKITEVMQKAHKGGLMKKVAMGMASSDEKAQLVKYYTALAASTPPAGLKENWDKKAMAMLDAAKKAAKGDDDAAKSLLKLVNCGACHKEFKK